MRKLVGATDAIFGEVRVGGIDDKNLVEFARTDLQTQKVASAQDVVLGGAKGQEQLFKRRVTRAQLQRAGRPFNHIDLQIDLVGGPGHFDRVDVDFPQITQSFDAVARESNFFSVIPGRLKLANLAPDDFIAGAGVARNVDATDIRTPRRVGAQNHSDQLGLAVELGHGFDAGKCVSKIAKVIGECLGGLGHLIDVVGLAGFNPDQRFEFVVSAQIVTIELDL